MPYHEGDILVPAYVASGLGFTGASRSFYFNNVLPAFRNIGIDVIDPWTMTDPKEAEYVLATEDAPVRVWRYSEFRQRVGRRNEEGIKRGKIVVANLDGTDADSGASGEVAFGYANGKQCFAWRDDWRNSGELVGAFALQTEYWVWASGGFVHLGAFEEFVSKLDHALDSIRAQMLCQTQS